MNLVWKHLLRGPKCREDTLNVNNDRLTCTGQNNVLLLQEVTSHRDTTTHSYLVGSTADTGNGDALCTHALLRKRSSPDRLHTSQIISERLGSCPCTTMFTFSAFITPRFASVSIGFGVPNSTSENSVPHMEPPHPSERPLLK